MARVIIVQVVNGYIVDLPGYQSEVFHTLEELFQRLLLTFEGRSDSFLGELYGKVSIERTNSASSGASTAST